MRCALSFLHIAVAKVFNMRGFSANIAQDLSPSTKLTIEADGKMRLERAIHTRRNVVIAAMNGGNITIGEKCFFNNGCMIVSKDRITIGERTSFGPNVVVYDHDHSTNRLEEADDCYKTSPVEIGKRVWIGANTVILRGTRIGDNCVIGAGSVIKGVYEPNTIVIQKRGDEIRKTVPHDGDKRHRQSGTEGGEKHGQEKAAGFKALV